MASATLFFVSGVASAEVGWAEGTWRATKLLTKDRPPSRYPKSLRKNNLRLVVGRAIAPLAGVAHWVVLKYEAANVANMGDQREDDRFSRIVPGRRDW